MSRPDLTPELTQWLIEQASAGRAPQEVLEAMQAQGWDEQAAIDAIETVVREHVERRAAEQGLPPAHPVPSPVGFNDVSAIAVDGHQVQVLMNLLLPRVTLFGGLLSDAECDGLCELAGKRLARSTTVDPATGANSVHAARTSDSMFFTRGENALCAAIEARIARLLDWPVDRGEGLQVLRYGVGAEYRPHYDYFDPEAPGTEVVVQRGGQRVASLVMYLNTPERGGSTAFPDAHMEVAAVKGNAVFFSYDRPHPVTRSLHAGSPVVAGEKWIATKWLRQSTY
ncbi:2OG-Fe(II) oxygenase [Pseudoxanthomonas composti]|uniref:2-oxoglutarate-dependent dioxygenase n=1 Tax=Pseudoxanthomonas composti TaxID=2137479 RepID=A0A4V1N1H8_9GAMM|nr:2OG-Fe(II) oxygenase [Pseudoxanthomonas composti]RXR08348.1 2-oxoglutarate-dependent dioxygenase [Pseudoxanthomonas composti]